MTIKQLRSLGGKARAAQMTPEQRSAWGKRSAEVRAEKKKAAQAVKEAVIVQPIQEGY